VEIFKQHHQRAMLCERRHKVSHPIEERRSGSNHVGGFGSGEGRRRGREIGFRLVVAERLRPRTVWRSFGKIVATARKRECAPICSFLAQRLGYGCLAYPCLAPEKHELAASVNRRIEQPTQIAQFPVATYEMQSRVLGDRSAISGRRKDAPPRKAVEPSKYSKRELSSE
jgi:hypothetical protein